MHNITQSDVTFCIDNGKIIYHITHFTIVFI